MKKDFLGTLCPPGIFSPRRLARLGQTLILIAVVAALSACATAPPKTDPVVERAKARWEALLSDDLETAYSYYSPGYRSTTSVVDFGVGIRMRRVLWTSADYRDHSCEDNRCKVRFDVGYKVHKPVPGLDEWDHTSVIEDTWVKTGGEWWYLPKKQ
jgi:hypothetical protein